MKKRLKAQLALNKRKRNAKKNQTLKETAQSEIIESDTLAEDGRSVQYAKYLVVLFTDTMSPASDTVLITYSSALKNVMDAGATKIEHLIRTKGVNNIQYVTFRQARLDQADKTDSQANDFIREKDIKTMLYRNGIPKSRVEYLDK